MGDTCQLHSEVTQRIGEFSAKIDGLSTQIERLSDESTDNGKITAKLLSDLEHLKDDMDSLEELLLTNQEAFDIYKTQSGELAHNFEELENCVKNLNSSLGNKVDSVKFDDFCYNIEKTLKSLRDIVDTKASKESVSNCNEWLKYVLYIVVSTVVIGLLKYIITGKL